MKFRGPQALTDKQETENYFRIARHPSRIESRRFVCSPSCNSLVAAVPAQQAAAELTAQL
jgi:hypothetical protein